MPFDCPDVDQLDAIDRLRAEPPRLITFTLVAPEVSPPIFNRSVFELSLPSTVLTTSVPWWLT